MNIPFTKMHGTGNDFVVINAIEQCLELSTEQIKNIANRHFGVGCDQLLLVEKPTLPDAEFRYRIFNANGGEVEHCGNGARCFAKYVLDTGLTSSSNIPVETSAGMIYLQMEENGQVTVDMGVPSFEPTDLPFLPQIRVENGDYQVLVNGDNQIISVVSIGNPHAVIMVDSVDTAPVETIGPMIEAHEQFPQHVNVGFIEIIDRSHIRLRVFERGAGETLACGTGACAAIAVGIRHNLLDDSVTAELRGGTISVQWSGVGQSIFLTGPAATVFEGQIEL